MPEEKTTGVIYVLTNPSFPDYVKIGYADDLEKRLSALNSTEATPFAFRVYATYEVPARLEDRHLHRLIDQLNPGLRSIDNVKGRRRVREFYAMSPEDAYSLLYAIAAINGLQDRLRRIPPTEDEREDQEVAEEIEEERRARRPPFSFRACGIPVGSELEFWRSRTVGTDIVVKVADDRHVEFEGEIWTLSGLAEELTGRGSVRGPNHFRYRGEWLNDVRDRCEGRDVL